MTDNPAAFRHHPLKSATPVSAATVDWRQAPAVCAHRRMTYFNRQQDKEFPVPVSASPAVIRNAGVIAGSDDGFLRFLNTGLDRVFWEHRLPAAIYASLVVNPETGQVIAVSTKGHATALSYKGEVVWRTDLGVPVFATPALSVRRDLLVMAGFHHTCIGLSATTGEVLFRTALPEPWATAFGGKAAFRNPYASPVMSARGEAILCSGSEVVKLGPDGREIWTCHLGAEIKASPLLMEQAGQVFVAAINGHIHGIDLGTGVATLLHRAAGRINASPAASGDILVFGTVFGTVVALSASHGKVVWEAPFGAPRDYSSFAVTPEGDFAATAESGNVVCLEATTGAFLWESSQVMGLANHHPQMNITPVFGGERHMFCGSYHGDFYQFAFPDRKDPADAR